MMESGGCFWGAMRLVLLLLGEASCSGGRRRGGGPVCWGGRVAGGVWQAAYDRVQPGCGELLGWLQLLLVEAGRRTHRRVWALHAGAARSPGGEAGREHEALLQRVAARRLRAGARLARRRRLDAHRRGGAGACGPSHAGTLVVRCMPTVPGVAASGWTRRAGRNRLGPQAS